MSRRQLLLLYGWTAVAIVPLLATLLYVLVDNFAPISDQLSSAGRAVREFMLGFTQDEIWSSNVAKIIDITLPTLCIAGCLSLGLAIAINKLFTKRLASLRPSAWVAAYLFSVAGGTLVTAAWFVGANLLRVVPSWVLEINVTIAHYVADVLGYVRWEIVYLYLMLEFALIPSIIGTTLFVVALAITPQRIMLNGSQDTESGA